MTTYRTDDRTGIRSYTAAELEDSRNIYVPAPQPQDDRQPLGEWYCPAADCVVREVRVSCKLLDPGDRVPAMHCPGCGEYMEFHHWLQVSTLVKVRD